MAYGHFERKIEVQHLIGTIDRSDVCVSSVCVYALLSSQQHRDQSWNGVEEWKR